MTVFGLLHCRVAVAKRCSSHNQVELRKRHRASHPARCLTFLAKPRLPHILFQLPKATLVMKYSPLLAVLPALCSISLLLGCGGQASTAVPVSGTVTVEGQPVEGGLITFISADGATQAAGSPIKDGAYAAEVEPGAKKVMVLGTKVVGEEYILKGVPDSGTRQKLETITHPNYNAKHLTPLTAEISGPSEDMNFDLKKNGKGS